MTNTNPHVALGVFAHVVLGCSMLSYPGMLAGQQPSGVATASAVLASGSPVTSLDRRMAGDTNRVLVGDVDFTRYTTPGMCIPVVNAVMQREGIPLDTARVDPTHDTLSTNAIRVARTCGARFTVANVPPRELLNLLSLSLIIGNEAEAQAAATKYLAHQTDSASRAWALFYVFDRYMHAHPSRRIAATAILHRLDAVQRPVLPRFMAHARLLWNAMMQWNVTDIRQEALTVLTLDRQLTPEERKNWESDYAGEAILDLFEVELVQSPVGAPARVAQTVAATGYQFPASAPQGVTVEQFLADLPLSSHLVFKQFVTRLGQPLPPFPARYLFGTTSTVVPTPGKVTLFIVGEPWLRLHAYPQYAILRRLKEKYGSKLDVVVEVKTQGTFRTSPPLTPTKEAKVFERYFLDFLKLPATIAVVETQFHRKADGRLVAQPSAFDTSIYGSTGMVVTDTHGGLFMIFPNAGMTEGAFSALIDRAVQTKTPPSTTQGSVKPETAVQDSVHRDSTASASVTSDSALRTALLTKLNEDQQARIQLMQQVMQKGGINPDGTLKDTAVAKQLMASDSVRAAWLENIVQDHGWPTRARVGADGVQAAFFIVQHGPVRIQKTMLPMIQAAAAHGELPASEVAYLVDRVLVFDKQPQQYGTQLVLDKNKRLVPLPIADSAHVDQRRAAVGLPSLEEYIRETQAATHQ